MTDQELEAILGSFQGWTTPIAMFRSRSTIRRLCESVRLLQKTLEKQNEEIAFLQARMGEKERALYEEVKELKARLDVREEELKQRGAALNDKETVLYNEFCSLRSKLNDKETALYNEVCALRSRLQNKEAEAEDAVKVAEESRSALAESRRQLKSVMEWIRTAHRLSERPAQGTIREVIERIQR